VLVGGLAAVALAVAPWNSFALVITGIVVGETGFMLGVDGLASHHQSGAMPGR
jgi:hypothetical protein